MLWQRCWHNDILWLQRPSRSLRDVLAHHMESLGTQGFTRREVRRMFRGIDDLRTCKICTPYDVEYAGGLARLTGRWLGFFMLISGRRPPS